MDHRQHSRTTQHRAQGQTEHNNTPQQRTRQDATQAPQRNKQHSTEPRDAPPHGRAPNGTAQQKPAQERNVKGLRQTARRTTAEHHTDQNSRDHHGKAGNNARKKNQQTTQQQATAEHNKNSRARPSTTPRRTARCVNPAKHKHATQHQAKSTTHHRPQRQQHHTPAHPRATDTQTNPAPHNRQTQKKTTNRAAEKKQTKTPQGKHKGDAKKKHKQGGGGKKKGKKKGGGQTRRQGPRQPGPENKKRLRQRRRTNKKRKKTQQTGQSRPGGVRTKNKDGAAARKGEAHQNAPGRPACPTRPRRARTRTHARDQGVASSDPKGAVSASTRNNPDAPGESPVDSWAVRETGRVSYRVNTRQPPQGTQPKTDAGGIRQGQPHRGAPNGYDAERARSPCLCGSQLQAPRARFPAGLQVPREAAQ